MYRTEDKATQDLERNSVTTPLGAPRHRWKDINGSQINKIGLERITLAQDGTK